MSKQIIKPEAEADLRVQAFSRLTGRSAPQDAMASASTALRVLHDLALAPANAADALALLHELQVHQVELALQEENLRDSLAELESALQRQTQLYDLAPVGCFTIDAGTAMHELNLAAAELLGGEREALYGQTLDSFLAPPSKGALQAMLARVRDGSPREIATLQLMAADGAPRAVHLHACVKADPGGRHYLVALAECVGNLV